jgi:hypothetical protein
MANETNKLKEFDVRTLEKTIAKALSELVGVELVCRIDDISYGDRSFEHGANFNVLISQPAKSQPKKGI